MDSNMTIMGSGYSLIIVYVILMLGKFDRLHQRVSTSYWGPWKKNRKQSENVLL